MSHSNYVLEVNGSACTLFADPENATSVNEGVTLIPWMGDSTSMIDRYDVRGHLYSESEFGLKKNDTDVDIEESKLEDELDKERYMFLTVDELEFEAYLEEEEKRFNNKKEAGGSYLQLGFSYGKSQEGIAQRNAQATSIADEVYVPDKALNIPDFVTMPTSIKHYKIIEKTAAFLSTQNLQTEIVIRTKQKDNPQFHFLEPDHELNPFYKHVLNAIKRKIITVKSDPKPKPEAPPVPPVPSVAEQQAHMIAQQELLLAAQRQEAERQQVLAQQRQRQEQEEAARGQWNKLGGEMLHKGEAKKGVGSSLAALSAYGAASDSENSSSDEEGEKPMFRNMINNMSTPIPVPPGTSPEVIQYLIMSGFVALPPPAPGLPQLLVPPAGYEGFSIPTAPPPPPPEEQVHVTTEEQEDIERPPSPSAEQKGIITKLAEYVVKNGDSFERKVQQKKDTRFAFVNPGNEHHSYYQYLIQKFRNKRVKLNVAPIKIKTKTTQLKPTATVDNTVFNQSSSEDEAEDEHAEKEEVSPSHVPEFASPEDPVSSSPPTIPETSSQTESYEDTTSQNTSQETATVSQTPSSPIASSPHPLDSDEECNLPTDDTTLIDQQTQDSPSKTPVYTHDTADRTPSPVRTPTDDQTHTPEIRSSVPGTPPREDSDVESIDSETKGRPLVQHFSDDSEHDSGSRYDLDGKRSRSSSKSPARLKSKSRSRSRQKNSSPTKSHANSPADGAAARSKKSRSRSHSRSRSKRHHSATRSRTPVVKRSRTRTRTRSYSKPRSTSQGSNKRSETPDTDSRLHTDRDEYYETHKREQEELRQREESLKKREAMLKKKEEILKKKEEELPEEGEISDSSTKRKHKKHKSDRDRERGRSRSASKHKKKKKDKSRKREDKSSESESKSSSTKKQKTEHKDDHKRKKTTPPRKIDTEEWMSEKMKKLSKIELLKEIEDKLEEKKKLREQQEKEKVHKHNEPSKDKTNKRDKKDRHQEKKEKDSVISDKNKKESKSNDKNGTRSLEDSKSEEDKKESKLDEEKRLAMERELAQIDAKLQAKRLKKQKEEAAVVKKQKEEAAVVKKNVSEKTNGHVIETRSRKRKDKKENSKDKKS